MSDMTLSEAAAEASKFGNTIRAFQKLQETAETLLGLEQNIAERTALRDSLGADIDKAQADLEATRAASIDQAAKNASGIAAARAEAGKTLTDASERAAAILADAKARSDAADALLAQANQDLAAVNANVAAATAELDAINARISSAKSAALAAFSAA